MSKTSKNGSGSGGDERNLYVRRYKSTSYPSKASSSNDGLAEPHGESESNNRSKNIGNTQKQYPGPAKQNIKNKLRSPTKVGLGQPTNRVNRPNSVIPNKIVKRTPVSKSQMTKMKQDIENPAHKQKSPTVQSENKESTVQVDNNKQINELNTANEESSAHQENGKVDAVNGKGTSSDNNVSENGNENGKSEHNGITESNDKEEEFNLELEVENIITIEETVSQDSSNTNKESSVQNESNTSTENVKDDSQTDTDSCSVDVVESTTSETIETTEISVTSEVQTKETENQNTNEDAVSYDSSITLKDVKIKLNDCLKDAKTEEENNADQSQQESIYKQATFGKTLRSISKRNSISYLRNVTLRDRQPSPNSSLFVNTSSISISEDGPSDYKILRHRSTLLDLSSSNGDITTDRKRKLTTDSFTAQKKPKTEGSSFINSSLEYLKYPFDLLRPKFSLQSKIETEKHSLGSTEEIKVETEEPGNIRKWCVLM